MAAAGGEDEKAVEELLSSSDLEATDNWGKTALMYCAQASLALKIIQAGGQLESKSKTGKTALVYAAQNGNG
jgi:ankyrin repeat protein